jgi:hypothetical protein
MGSNIVKTPYDKVDEREARRNRYAETEQSFWEGGVPSGMLTKVT